MKCVNTFKTREKASEARLRLNERGIESRIIIDTIDGRYGGLSSFDNVALMVREDQWKAASAIIADGRTRQAS